MLIVLMVLLMTTATATFAMHSTSIEIRASGHARQAMQAEHLAIGGAYAGLGYADWLTPQGVVDQYNRTTIAANVKPSPREESVATATNRLRIPMSDFQLAVVEPPIEIEAAHTPSFGPRSAYVPNFVVDGSDLHLVTRDVAGRDLTGRGTNQLRITLTSHGWMAPRDAPEGTYHEVAMRARAITEAGPVWPGGH